MKSQLIPQQIRRYSHTFRQFLLFLDLCYLIIELYPHATQTHSNACSAAKNKVLLYFTKVAKLPLL